MAVASDWIKQRIGTLDGRSIDLAGSGGGGSGDTLTDQDIAAALASTGFKDPLIPKVLEWCYLPSGERHAEELYWWIEARAKRYLEDRPPTTQLPDWLVPRILNHVLEEKRWQWSHRITQERRYHTKQTRRVEQLKKDGVLPQDFQVSKPRTASDRAHALGLRGKNYHLWREIQPLFQHLEILMSDLEYVGMRQMRETLKKY